MLANRTLGEQLNDAILDSAEARTEALRCRKRADRLLDVEFLRSEGKNADERRAKARTSDSYTRADLEAVEAECEAIKAKAKADGLQILWESWRTEQSTRRAEMNLR
jgi:hypothetical protein